MKKTVALLISFVFIFSVYGGTIRINGSQIQLSFSNGLNFKSIRQSDGRFKTTISPLFCFKSKHAYFGEIRENGILKLLLDPMTSAAQENILDQNAVKRNISVTDTPFKTGLVLENNMGSLIFLNSALYKKSPDAFGFTVKDKALKGWYFAAMVQTNGKSEQEEELDRYQINWTDLENAEVKVYSLIGINMSKNGEYFSYYANTYMRNYFNNSFNSETNIGTELAFSIGNTVIHAIKRTGKEKEFKKPMEITQIEAQFGKNFILKTKYLSQLYSKPIYGGSGQEKTVEFKTSFISSGFSISENNSIYYSKSGKITETKNYGCEMIIAGKDFAVSTEKKGTKFTETRFSFSDEKSDFSISGTGTDITFRFAFEIASLHWRITLDQSKVITVAIHYTKKPYSDTFLHYEKRAL